MADTLGFACTTSPWSAAGVGCVCGTSWQIRIVANVSSIFLADLTPFDRDLTSNHCLTCLYIAPLLNIGTIFQLTILVNRSFEQICLIPLVRAHSLFTIVLILVTRSCTVIHHSQIHLLLLLLLANQVVVVCSTTELLIDAAWDHSIARREVYCVEARSVA